MNCTFFGHKDAPASIKASIEKAIISLIDVGVKTFYVGNNGNFDYLVQNVLKELSCIYDMSYLIVLSRVDEVALSGEQAATLFPEKLDFSIPKFAISKRNEWLIKKCDFAIVYVKNRYSNSYKWLERAQKKGLKIITL